MVNSYNIVVKHDFLLTRLPIADVFTRHTRVTKRLGESTLEGAIFYTLNNCS